MTEVLIYPCPKVTPDSSQLSLEKVCLTLVCISPVAMSLLLTAVHITVALLDSVRGA